jgi:hypothetical protein
VVSDQRKTTAAGAASGWAAPRFPPTSATTVASDRRRTTAAGAASGPPDQSSSYLFNLCYSTNILVSNIKKISFNSTSDFSLLIFFWFDKSYIV